MWEALLDFQVLCDAECNNRIDLLTILPALSWLSAVALGWGPRNPGTCRGQQPRTHQLMAKSSRSRDFLALGASITVSSTGGSVVPANLPGTGRAVVCDVFRAFLLLTIGELLIGAELLARRRLQGRSAARL